MSIILLDVTKHAADRAKERFGIDPNQAKHILNKAFKESKYLCDGENGGKLYLSDNDMVLVVSEQEKKIITCYSKGEVPVILTDSIRDDKSKREIKAVFEKRIKEMNFELNKLETEKLELDLEICRMKKKAYEAIDEQTKDYYFSEIGIIIDRCKIATEKRNKANKDRSNLVNDFSFILNEDLKNYMYKY